MKGQRRKWDEETSFMTLLKRVQLRLEGTPPLKRLCHGEGRKRITPHPARFLAISLTLFSLLGPDAAWALPHGGSVLSGKGSISSNKGGTLLTIQQTSHTLSLNWSSFNLSQNQTVDFIQPSFSSVALNFIGGAKASQIFGDLNSNGQVYLINPYGIVFGKNAQVNVGGLVAAAMDLQKYGFGKTLNFIGSGSIENAGSIHALPGGAVVLLGQKVENTGTVSATNGVIALGAGNRISLDFSGNDLVDLVVDQKTAQNVIDNGGILAANGGKIILKPEAQQALVNSVINNTGNSEAQNISEQNGTIVLASFAPNTGGRHSSNKGGNSDNTPPALGLPSPSYSSGTSPGSNGKGNGNGNDGNKSSSNGGSSIGSTTGSNDTGGGSTGSTGSTGSPSNTKDAGNDDGNKASSGTTTGQNDLGGDDGSKSSSTGGGTSSGGTTSGGGGTPSGGGTSSGGGSTSDGGGNSNTKDTGNDDGIAGNDIGGDDGSKTSPPPQTKNDDGNYLTDNSGDDNPPPPPKPKLNDDGNTDADNSGDDKIQPPPPQKNDDGFYGSDTGGDDNPPPPPKPKLNDDGNTDADNSGDDKIQPPPPQKNDDGFYGSDAGGDDNPPPPPPPPPPKQQKNDDGNYLTDNTGDDNPPSPPTQTKNDDGAYGSDTGGDDVRSTGSQTTTQTTTTQSLPTSLSNASSGIQGVDGAALGGYGGGFYLANSGMNGFTSSDLVVMDGGVKRLGTINSSGSFPFTSHQHRRNEYFSSVDQILFQDPENRHLHALVIGVERYSLGIQTAQFANRDAEVVSQYFLALGVPPEHIQKLMDANATRDQIQSSLKWLEKNVKAGETVYIYYSGHGSPGPNGEAYIVPSDGNPSNLKKTGISIESLFKSLNNLPARHVVLLMDAGFNGRGNRSIVGKGSSAQMPKIHFGKLPTSGKVIAFSSAKPDQESGILQNEGHGLFTYYFLKGLDKGGVKKGHVTLATLYKYLEPKVTDMALSEKEKQTPLLEPSLSKDGTLRFR